MQRIPSTPRPDWEKTVESQGFYFHSPEGQPYWDESAYYQFTAAEVDAIEAATYALDKMCQEAVQAVVDRELWEQFQIPPTFVDFVRRSWDQDELTIVGRFDLAYVGSGPPKLLEYNADTPTSLLEASVIQWHWMQDVLPNADQFNSIHERLIEAWGMLPPALKHNGIHFSALSGHLEDYMTVQYLRDTATQAGFKTTYIEVERLGWNTPRQRFVDETETPIELCFKLYPWEWLIREQFGPNLLQGRTYWLESPWKMILSNKALLPLLWEMFPGSPYLLPASFEPLPGDYVRKPQLAREGANITIVAGGKTVLETEGTYGGPWVYQQLIRPRDFGNRFAVIGSWMVNGYACGMGIREDDSWITHDTSRFVPHVFVK